jgi:hypothetical protein
LFVSVLELFSFSSVKMEAVSFSKMLVSPWETTWFHDPKENNLSFFFRNLKSRVHI